MINVVVSLDVEVDCANSHGVDLSIEAGSKDNWV